MEEQNLQQHSQLQLGPYGLQLTPNGRSQLPSSASAAIARAAAVPGTTISALAAAAARTGSSGSNPLLFGEMSLDQSPSSNVTGSATAPAGGFGAVSRQGTGLSAAPASSSWNDAEVFGGTVDGETASIAICSALGDKEASATVFNAGLRHHRRYVYHTASSADAGRSPESTSGDAELENSSIAGAPLNNGLGGNGVGLPWVDTAAPANDGQEGAADAAAAAAAACRGGAAVSESTDFNSSSCATRRSTVTFKPYPPDSPNASAQQQQQQQSGVGLHQRSAGASRTYRSALHSSTSALPDGAAHAASRLRSHSVAGTFTTSAREFSASSYAAAESGGSGGGLGSSGSYAQHHDMQELRRSRSARLSHSSVGAGNIAYGFNPLYGHHNGHHHDNLTIAIPPPQQGPPSRLSTPTASAGGTVGSYGGVLGPQLSGHLPPQPWGLPADAALLSSTLGSAGAVGYHGTAATAAPAGMHGPVRATRQRLSTTGLPSSVGHAAMTADCNVGPLSSTAHGRAAASPIHSGRAVAGFIPAGGHYTSRAASVLSSEGTAAAVLGGGSSDCNIDTAGTTVDLSSEVLNGLKDVGDDSAAVQAAAKARAQYYWSIAREAFNSKLLLELPCRESYSVVSATFKRLFPHDFDQAIPVINHKRVDTLLLQWEAAVGQLERAEMKLQRTGRQPVRIKGLLGPLLSCCATMGCVCRGCMGRGQLLGACCQERVVEIIPEIQSHILSLEEEIDKARRNAFKSDFTNSWFVLFKSQAAAAMAASTRIYAENNTQFQVHPAPGPEEVNWQHLWMSWQTRFWRTAIAWPFILLVVLFPITLITSAVSRLDYVFCPDVSPGDLVPPFVWDWYCTGKDVNSSVPSFLRAFITGWLPSLLLNLWLVMVLPRLVYIVVQSEGGCFSLSALERRIGAVFFYWDIFNVFLQGIIGSTFFQQVRHIIQSPEQLPNILGAALPDSSNFFMQFIAMRALFLIWLRMCVPHGGVWQNWCHYCWCPRCCCSVCNTDRDQSLTYGPRTPRYGFEMGHMLLMYLIPLAFSVVSPLLLPFSVVWFAFAWVAWRHNLSYVYQRKYESGGLMWIFLFSRIVMCLVIGQLFTFCVLVVRGAYWQAFLTIAFLPAFTARFYQ
eukprot:GHRR01013169.1.p1 GENE.GHRR01013169.1~~GHRR01013169.1.p1  ORF type:complete len:1229 (+),score=453.96 GHRR01013169.1:316-3687(+)